VIRLVRLHPAQPESWALWPVFEARVLSFQRRIAEEGMPEQLIEWLRESFIKRPDILGAWIALDDEHVVGHLLGWADAYFGEPYVFVYQTETDPNATMQEGMRERMVDELRHWIDALNWAYERAQSPLRMTRVKFATGRHDRAWAGYLKGLGRLVKTRAVLTFEVGVTPALQPPPMAAVNGEGR
jgi:hypothetical protein